MNVRSGKLIAAWEDTTPAASPLGVSVSHVYNPDEANAQNVYGAGFRLNLDESLKSYEAAMPFLTVK